jgi:hypothetical protein
VLVEVAEAAAVPVRSRILARLRVAGRAVGAADGAGQVSVRPAAVTLEESGITAAVDVAAFDAARPDPLGCFEASFLSHLDAAHPDAVAALTRLVDPRRLYGVVRVWPLRLDRFGVVLRLEHLRRDQDVRLPFADPAVTADEARAGLHALVEAGRRRRPCQGRGPG